MTETLVAVEPSRDEAPDGAPFGTPADAGLSPEELAAMAGLVRKAREQGVAVTGPGGLLKALTKTVIETALEEEMVDHLGYGKHDPVGRNRAKSRIRWGPIAEGGVSALAVEERPRCSRRSRPRVRGGSSTSCG